MPSTTPDPPSTFGRGVRRPYATLPLVVQNWIGAQLGGTVVGVVDAIGGFAPGVAAVVHRQHRSIFVKVACSSPNPVSLELYQQERTRLRALPDHPMIVHPLADADLTVGPDTYSMTVFPALPGRPPAHPWSPADAELVFDRLGELQRDLTAGGPVDLPGSEHLHGFFGLWPAIAASAADPWRRRPDVSRRLEDYLAADEQVVARLSGSQVAHIDLRADNLLLERPGTGAGRVWFVDWAAAVLAAPWVDPAILACDLVISHADRADGGTFDVWSFLARHPTTAAVPPELRWAMVVSLAGALHTLSLGPAPPGLPTIRGWQSRCAESLLAFADRTSNGNLGAAERRW